MGRWRVNGQDAVGFLCAGFMLYLAWHVWQWTLVEQAYLRFLSGQ